MKHLQDFQQHNEGIMTGVMLGIAWILLYRFLFGLLKDLDKRFLNGGVDKKIINSILNSLTIIKNKKSDQFNVTELQDRYFIRVDTDNGVMDIRVMKFTKEMEINNQKVKLTDEQFDEFLKMIK